MFELTRIEARTAVGHCHVQAIVLDAGLDDDLAIGRRVLRGVLEHVRERDRHQTRIDFGFEVSLGVHAQRVSLERVPNVRARGIDDVGCRHPLLVHTDGCCVDARHIEDVLEQAGEAMQLHAGGARLFTPLLGWQLTTQVFDGRLDRRQRCAQIVAQRREERRREVGLLPNQVRRIPLGQELRALDRDRHDAGKRVERADVEC